MDIKSFIVQGVFEEKEKLLSEASLKANVEMANMERDVQKGARTIDREYFDTYVRSMKADADFSRVYLDSLKEAYDGFMREANDLSVISSCDVKNMAEAASEVFDTYNQICEQLDENERELSKAVEEAEDFCAQIILGSLYKQLVDAYKAHIELYGMAREYRSERLYDCVMACEQLTQDLGLLRKVEEEMEE